MGRNNEQSRARRRTGRKLAQTIVELGLNTKDIAHDTGIDLVTLDNLDRFTPHLSTIERVTAYLEEIARMRRAERLAGKTDR